MIMEDGQVQELAGKQGAELIQTHISWVLIGKEEVFKIKKPVKFSFLDFSSLDRRKMFCDEEVRLNRRLSPDVYLGVVPIIDAGGALSFGEAGGPGGKGKILDYAVRMKKLDRGRMMDRLIKQGMLGKADVEALARIVADFHDKAEVVKDDFGSPALVWSQAADLASHRGTIEKACRLGKWVDDILSRSERFVKGNDALFRERVKGGRIRDCHGDLHTRNVFFQDGVRVFDCIEFSRDFRCIDVASDIAFMAMDLDYLGREDLSKAFVDEYVSRSGDSGVEALLPFYKCYRANVRAKIAAIEWGMGGEKEEDRQGIDRYTLLAAKYARGL